MAGLKCYHKRNKSEVQGWVQGRLLQHGSCSDFFINPCQQQQILLNGGILEKKTTKHDKDVNPMRGFRMLGWLLNTTDLTQPAGKQQHP